MSNRTLSSQALDDDQKTARLIAELINSGLEILDPDEVAPYPALIWDGQDSDVYLDLLDYDTGNTHKFKISLTIEKLGVTQDPDWEPYYYEEDDDE